MIGPGDIDLAESLIAATRLVVLEWNSGPFGQHRPRLEEVDLFPQLNELEDVAADPAPEALKDLLILVNGERGGLFLVERTQALEVRSGSAQRNVTTDNIDDINALAYTPCDSFSIG